MRILAGLAGALMVSASAAQADWYGICGMYQQVWSNAGACPGCSLIVADNPEIQFYFVESNNGWTAELTWVEGDESTATGEGKWGNVGGVYNNQGFDIDLYRDRAILTMDMTMHDPSVAGTVQAQYLCTDGSM